MVNGTSKEPGRPILDNICLRDGKLAAADGFMLVTRDADIVEGKHEGDTLLPASIVRTIKSSPKRQAELVIDDGTLSVSYKDGLNRPVDFDPTLQFKPYTGGTFPKYSQIFPEDTTKKAHIALDVRVLKKVLACLPDNGILRIGITEPYKPMEFECSNLDRPIRGLVMPLNVDWQEFKWYREEETKEVENVE